MSENSLSKNVPMEVRFRVDDDASTIRKEVATKYFGLLEDNRAIDSKRVGLFAALIDENRYYEAYPIICCEATNLTALGKKITDLDGNKIPDDKLSDYLIIMDGQHRVTAFNSYNLKNPDKQKTVPNVNIINADSAESVLKFLYAINTAGKDWIDSDRWHVARNLNNEVVDKINELIKKFEFNHSVAQKIYLGKRLNKKEFSSLLAGNVSLINNLSKERIEFGDTFISVCFELSGNDEKKMKLFAKRYFIEGIDDFSKGKTYKGVFEVLKKIKYEELKKVKSTIDFGLMLMRAK